MWGIRQTEPGMNFAITPLRQILATTTKGCLSAVLSGCVQFRVASWSVASERQTQIPFGNDKQKLLLQVEAVKVHYLGPSGDEVFDELLLVIVGGVDLGESAELGVGAED
jgi:hypothetical protein